MKHNAKIWVIIDKANQQFFSRTHDPVTGWYTDDLASARFYKTERAARLVVDSNSFKVTYPGNRLLEVRSYAISPTVIKPR